MSIPPAEAVPLPLPRVLFVDDDADTLAIIGKALTRMGFAAIPAASCEAARDAVANTGIPDVTICDAALSDGSGLTLAANLKARCGCAIIILSGYAPPADGLPGGIDDWLLTPVSLDVLRDAVRSMLKRREGERETAGA